MVDPPTNIAASNRATVLAMNIEQAQEDKGNRLYDSEEKRYRTWVDKNDPDRAKFGLEPSRYISTDALASYFLHEQAHRSVQGRTALKAVYALSRLAKKEGAVGVLGTDGKSIQTGPTKDAIEVALKSIRANYTRKRSVEDNECPQQHDPTNIIGQEAQSIVLAKVLSRHDKHWSATASTWATAANTLIRFENVKKVRLNRLKVLEDLPPHGIETPHDTESWESVRRATDGRVLGIIIPPSDQIKKNAKRDDLKPEVVGGYRHKRYERCYHGIIGFNLLERLNDGQALSFKKKSLVPEGSTHWTDIHIFHYKYDSANKAFKRAREYADVDHWLKSTHMR